MLVGGRGNDTITGGRGRDSVVYEVGGDIITDYHIKQDTLIFDFTGDRYVIDSKDDLVMFVNIIEHDTDNETDAILNGSDLYPNFGDNTNYIMIENISGKHALTQAQLDSVGVDYWTEARLVG